MIECPGFDTIVIMLHVAYVLICSLSFSALDLLRKYLAGAIKPIPLVVFIALGAVPAMLAWLAIEGAGDISAPYWIPGLASVFLNIAANIGFVYSVKLSSLSRTIPLLSLTPVFTSLMAVPILQEYPSPRQALGILFVVAGALSLNLDKARGGTLRAIALALLRERGSLLMAGVALLWSVAAALDKSAIGFASAPFHGTVLSIGVAVGAILYLQGQRRIKELTSFRESPKLIIVMMICASLALAFQLLSIQVILVSLVETFKRAIGSFMAVFLGRVIFGESVTLHKVTAITAMVVGVALILS
jgi:drug/metabolite transporter (DMT)-like permease